MRSRLQPNTITAAQSTENEDALEWRGQQQQQQELEEWERTALSALRSCTKGVLRKIHGFVCPLMQPGISRRIHDARFIPPTVLRSEGDGNYL